MLKFNAAALRTTLPDKKDKDKIKRNDIYIILDNILDTYNTGSIFRLADAVAAKKIFLCKDTEIPPNTRIKKASINTTQWVDWEYAQDTSMLIKRLKADIKNLSVVAIEQDKRSKPYDNISYKFPIALVVGNETSGISQDVISLCDQIVELPMFGANKSLNVMVSLGVVLYEVLKHI